MLAPAVAHPLQAALRRSPSPSAYAAQLRV